MKKKPNESRKRKLMKEFRREGKRPKKMYTWKGEGRSNESDVTQVDRNEKISQEKHEQRSLLKWKNCLSCMTTTTVAWQRESERLQSSLLLSVTCFQVVMSTGESDSQQPEVSLLRTTQYSYRLTDVLDIARGLEPFLSRLSLKE